LNGTIFDIKRFAIHDGPGIRTTIFFKGCPLHCVWCHNPEGIESRFELMPNPRRCAADCTECLKVCPDVLAKKDGRIVLQRAVRGDALCSSCADACVYDALRLVGKRVTAEDITTEVEKDRIFYEQSGGGVTFSGGEPLLQPVFLSELIDELKIGGFHLALDTSGFAAWEVLDGIARKCDLILYDLKTMDDAMHRKYTGVSNRLILDNLKRLSSVGKEIWVRVPLVPGVNDDEENMRRTADFLRPLPNIKRVSVLPYHKGGCEKYTNLGKGAGFRTFEPPSEERVGAVLGLLSSRKFQVRRGG
jgi:pyruvate formate lyase activating enzyme